MAVVPDFLFSPFRLRFLLRPPCPPLLGPYCAHCRGQKKDTENPVAVYLADHWALSIKSPCCCNNRQIDRGTPVFARSACKPSTTQTRIFVPSAILIFRIRPARPSTLPYPFLKQWSHIKQVGELQILGILRILRTADSRTHGLADSHRKIFCGWNDVFFADTQHVQQLSNKVGMLLPSVRVV